ncbi:MAG: hypothetical protein ACLGG9_01640 [Thermoleophilia bacterium]
MPLTLSEDQARAVAQLDIELRLGAEAIGTSLAPRIAELAPALAPAEGGEPEALLAELDLDHEGGPDALSLAACIAAHRAYVAGRGRPSAVSAGGLAIARLLAWAHRAALLGAAPSVTWIGPAARLPEPGPGQVVLRARSAVRVGQSTRRAEAAALLTAPTARA